MTIKQQTENILKVSHQARNSDKRLEVIYMQKFGMNLTKEQISKYMEMPSLGAVRRERRRFQEIGLYLADKAVNEKRFEKYTKERETAPIETRELANKVILPWGE